MKNMTLGDAIVLKEKWKAKGDGKICPHNQLIHQVMSKKGSDTGYQVCMVCGEVFLDHGEPLSLSEFKTLLQLSSEED